MNEIRITLTMKAGRRGVPVKIPDWRAFEVEGTEGTLAVHRHPLWDGERCIETEEWDVTHVPSGRAVQNPETLHVEAAVAAAQRFYAEASELGINLKARTPEGLREHAERLKRAVRGSDG